MDLRTSLWKSTEEGSGIHLGVSSRMFSVINLRTFRILFSPLKTVPLLRFLILD